MTGLLDSLTGQTLTPTRNFMHNYYQCSILTRSTVTTPPKLCATMSILFALACFFT